VVSPELRAREIPALISSSSSSSSSSDEGPCSSSFSLDEVLGVDDELTLKVAKALNRNEFVDAFENEEENFQTIYCGKQNIISSTSLISCNKSNTDENIKKYPPCGICGLPLEQGRNCLCCSVAEHGNNDLKGFVAGKLGAV